MRVSRAGIFPAAVALGLLIAMLLTACGDREATPQPTSPTDQPAALLPTPTPLQEEVPAETPEATNLVDESPLAVETLPPSPSALAAIRDILLARAQDQAMLDATLYQITSLPVPGGQATLFHWEDLYGGTTVACTGYAVVNQAEGAANEIRTISAGCAGQPIQTPITIYPARGFDVNGEEVTVIFGEIYDEAVANIRASIGGAEYMAMMTGSGYLIELPPNMPEVSVTAYDAAGSALFSGSPSSEQ